MQEFDFLASLEFFGVKLGLHQTEELFRRLGSPEKELQFIHVAGSNGKGSTCAFLENAFRAAGVKTGFYSSPHLIQVNERFRINGIPVADEPLKAAIRRLEQVAAGMAQDGMKITYFEATTALAAMLFKEAQCQIVLWETGMGGRLDATNIITPLASVITGISLEHTQYLGDTLEKIAAEKAGIIKPERPVFVASRTPRAALDVIRRTAEDKQAAFHCSPQVDPATVTFTPHPHFSQSFRLNDGTCLTVPLPGPHQRENAALAWSVICALHKDLSLDPEVMRRSFADVRWDGRFQFIPGKPLVVDSGHNPEGIGVLVDTLKELYPGRKFHFIFGAFSDKDTIQSLKMLAPLAESFLFLQMETMRASYSPGELAAQLRDAVGAEIPWRSVSLEEAIKEPQDMTVLCGSLHLCGDALAELARIR